MKPMVLSLTGHSSYQLLNMINPKLYLLNSFLAFLQCVSVFALYTFPSWLHLIAVFVHVIPGLHVCTSFNLDAGYKILLIVSLLLKSQNVYTINSSCGYYTCSCVYAHNNAPTVTNISPCTNISDYTAHLCK